MNRLWFFLTNMTEHGSANGDGIFMAPIGWFWGGAVWLNSLAWFLIEDRAKLAAYRIFNREIPGLLEKHP